MTDIAWYAYAVIPRHERVEGGPKDRPEGEAFFARDAGMASAWGRKRLGRSFTRVKSVAAMRLDGDILPHGATP